MLITLQDMLSAHRLPFMLLSATEDAIITNRGKLTLTTEGVYFAPYNPREQARLIRDSELYLKVKQTLNSPTVLTVATIDLLVRRIAGQFGHYPRTTENLVSNVEEARPKQYTLLCTYCDYKGVVAHYDINLSTKEITQHKGGVITPLVKIVKPADYPREEVESLIRLLRQVNLCKA